MVCDKRESISIVAPDSGPTVPIGTVLAALDIGPGRWRVRAVVIDLVGSPTAVIALTVNGGSPQQFLPQRLQGQLDFQAFIVEMRSAGTLRLVIDQAGVGSQLACQLTALPE